MMGKEEFSLLGAGAFALLVVCGIVLIVRRMIKVERSRAAGSIGIALLTAVLVFSANVTLEIIASINLSADTATLKSTMGDWHRAILMYAKDNDDHLPLSENWEQEARAYLSYGDTATLRDPVTDLKKGIGYNAAIAGMSLVGSDYDTVILISGKNARPIEQGGPIADDPSALIVTLEGRATGMWNQGLIWTLPNPSPHDEVHDQSPDPAPDQE
ncbi:MAG: hypothetical protein IH945_09260 [Armatimonadetes bacterium]|nr:hypothetical protein [Armatimonadota bacterium]